MAIKVYKPTTHSRRKMSVTDYSILTKKEPEKKLTVKLNRSAGRDNTGQISVRHKGGGNKRKYRIISSLSDKLGQKATVTALEYDPNRSSFIALVEYQEDKTKAYILAWENLKVGEVVEAADKAEITPGNRMRLENIPTGISIFDIEIHPGQGGKMVKGAGAQAVILSKDGEYVQVKMPSGEIRKINKKCFASIGQTSNATHFMVRIGKAGRKRHMGVRPTVRGKAMNPNSHPHGGGEGQNSIGMKYPKTPWGKHALGVRTRKKNKYSNKLIVKRRAK
ncbi:MAG: 50S ribosomal protein L2 [Candidatus Berkelbacteria bacterium]